MWNVNDLAKNKREKIVKYLNDIIKTRRTHKNIQILVNFWNRLPPVVKNLFENLYKSYSFNCSKHIKDNDLSGPYIYSILSVLENSQFIKKTKKGRTINVKLTKRGRNIIKYIIFHI